MGSTGNTRLLHLGFVLALRRRSTREKDMNRLFFLSGSGLLWRPDHWYLRIQGWLTPVHGGFRASGIRPGIYAWYNGSRYNRPPFTGVLAVRF
jgi:hypothetical protein